MSPQPFTPADADLRAFEFMPLDVVRFRKSKALAMLPPEHFVPWFSLILESWHQLPAASLPDDDIELANLAGFGRQVNLWSQVREGALYGWVKCSDGRLYHAVVAEKANEAWLSRLNDRHRKYAYREKKAKRNPKPFKEWLETASPDTFALVHGTDGGCPNHVPGTKADVPGTGRGQRPVSHGQFDERERERERDRDRETLDSGGGPPPAAPDESKADLDAVLYRRGKAVLGRSAGGQITKLKNLLGVGGSLEALEQAKRKENPAEYVAGILRARARDAGEDTFDATTPENRAKCVAHYLRKAEDDPYRWLEAWGPPPTEEELARAALASPRAEARSPAPSEPESQPAAAAESVGDLMEIPPCLRRPLRAAAAADAGGG